MSLSRLSRASLVALLLCALLGTGACSSSDSNPTAPPPSGTTKELDSGNIPAGGTYEHRFATAGSYAYHCIYHSAMTGTVVVATSATDTLVAVSMMSSTSPFPGATVKPGGRVVWTNHTSMTHTVTSN